jgi:predicted nucleic acid-binding protein
VLDEPGGRLAQRSFAREWSDFVRLPVTDVLVARAEALAWDHGLRGYDAVQLAAALAWQGAVGQDVVLATFDRQLWEAAPREGLQAWPERLPGEPR